MKASADTDQLLAPRRVGHTDPDEDEDDDLGFDQESSDQIQGQEYPDIFSYIDLSDSQFESEVDEILSASYNNMRHTFHQPDEMQEFLSDSSTQLDAPRNHKLSQEKEKEAKAEVDESPIEFVEDAFTLKDTECDMRLLSEKIGGNPSDQPGMNLSTGCETESCQNSNRKATDMKTQSRIENDKKLAAMSVQNQIGGENIKRMIELSNGITIRSRNNIHLMTNAFSLQTYEGWTGILWFFYDILKQTDHIVLLIGTLLEYMSGAMYLNDFSHLITTCIMSFLATGFMNILENKEWKKAAESVNQKPVERFVATKNQRSRFVHSNWAQIQCGDIIKIYANQEMPCDALILDIIGSRGRFQTCYSRGGIFDQDKNPTLKSSYPDTMNKTNERIQASKIADQITGVLTWEYNHQGQFRGFFNQQNSVGNIEITMENVLQRGSYLQCATQALCLAINVGPNIIGNQDVQTNSNEGVFDQSWHRSIRQSHVESVHFKALKYIQVASIGFCMLPCIMIVLQDLLLKNLHVSQFVETFAGEQTHAQLESYEIIAAGFLHNFPYLARHTMEAVIFFHAYFVLWDINLVPAQVNINNLKVMKSLSQIDSVVCQNNAFIQHNLSFPIALQINREVYFNKNDNKFTDKIFKAPYYESCDIKQNSKDKDTQCDSSLIEYHSEEEEDDQQRSTCTSKEKDNPNYLPNNISFDPAFYNYRSKKVLQDKAHPENKQFREMLKALTLCHNSIRNKKIQICLPQLYKSLYKDEEAQLQLADSFDYQFIGKKFGKITVLHQGIEKHYEEFYQKRILVDQDYKDYITVTIVKPESSPKSGLTIYYRGNLRALCRFLPQKQRSENQKDFIMFKEKGIHVFGLAKHELNMKDSITLLSILKQNRSKSKDQSQNDHFLLKLAKNMKLIGTFCVQAVFNYRDTLLIEELKQNNIQIIMLNGEDADTVYTDCKAMHFLDDGGNYTPVKVKGNTECQVEESLIECLNQVLKRRNEGTSHYQLKDSQKSTKSSKDSLDDDKNNGDEPEEQNQKEDILFFKGKHLDFILRDQSLEKIFLSLSNFCSMSIGSQITPQQKQLTVRAMRKFAEKGQTGNVLGLISQQQDKLMINEVDVSIGLITSLQQSEILARTDIQLKSLYGIGYLLFKHATLTHRRTKVVVTEFLGRTCTTMLISMFFFVVYGFSYSLPYGKFFFSFFMAVQSPLQFFMQGITEMDYGFSVFHRVTGEYQCNLIQSVSLKEILWTCVYSSSDALVVIVCYYAAGLAGCDFQIDPSTGDQVSWTTQVILNDVFLSILNIYRSRSIKTNVMMYWVINHVFTIAALLTILKDYSWGRIYQAVQAPNVLFCGIFIMLYVHLKQFIRLLIDIQLPCNNKQDMCYKAIEDRLYMEEYENPETQFSITHLNFFSDVVKELARVQLYSINKNLVEANNNRRLDQIFERLNYQETNDGSIASYINTRTLVLHNVKKEIEYSQLSKTQSKVMLIIPLLWSSMSLYAGLLAFKAANSIIVVRYNLQVLSEIPIQADGDINLEAMPEKSTYKELGSTIQSSYFEILQATFSLVFIGLVKKWKYRKAHLLAAFLIVFSNIIILFKFFEDQHNPLIQIQFFFTIALSFGLRLSSVYFASIVCVIASVGFLQIRLSVIMGDMAAEALEGASQAFQITWMAAVMVIYVAQWVYFSYTDELWNKVNFVSTCERAQNLKKLKAVADLLIPSLVRGQMQDGKKIQLDLKAKATVIWIEVDDFDYLVEKYHGSKFTELLGKIFSGLEALADKHGIQVIDTISKVFVAASGLQFCEKNMDPETLAIDPTVRVIQFADEAQCLISRVALHGKRTASIRIGVDAGSVSCGIVGDIKSQFVVIGQHVDRARHICRSSRPNSITISARCYARVVNKIQNIEFEPHTFTLDGVFTQVYTSKYDVSGERRKYIQGLSVKNDGKSEEDSEESEYSESNNISFDSDLGCNMNEQQPEDSGEIDDNDDDEDDDFIRRNFDINLDDRKIVKLAALNDMYKLVERPRWLLSFTGTTWESSFSAWVFERHFHHELYTYLMKSIFDLIISQAMVVSIYDSCRLEVNLIVGVCVIAIKAIELAAIFLQKPIRVRYIAYQQLSFVISVSMIIIIGPEVNNLVQREAIEETFALYMMIAFLTRSLQLKKSIILISILTLSFIGQNYISFMHEKINIQTFIIEFILYTVFNILLIQMIHQREMKYRQAYNNNRLIEVDTQRTNILLDQIVPFHALAHIKADENVTDELQDVTILYAKIHGFSELFNSKKESRKSIAFLQRIYNKFDQLCAMHSVYKVHTLCQTYVAMGFKGQTDHGNRTKQDAAEEAKNIMILAHKMMIFIEAQSKKFDDPLMKNLSLQIGINTGNVTGFVIGSSVLRYDIFGQDVLIASQVMKKTVMGQIFAAQSTRTLLSKTGAFYDTVIFTDGLQFELKTNCSIVRIVTFRVELLSDDRYDFFRQFISQPKVKQSDFE